MPYTLEARTTLWIKLVLHNGFERKRKAHLALAGKVLVLLVLAGSRAGDLNPKADGLQQR